ncbi:MAG TPA: hypothetical protein VII92_09475, partial [Anaerolineae bacterium]
MLNRIVKWLVLSALIVVALSIAAPLIVRADPVPPDLVQALVDQTGGQVQIEYHRQTGQVRFIGTDPARPIPHAADLRAEAAPEEAARSFLGAYGSLFGLKDQAQELIVKRSQAADRDRSFVRFQQVYQGIPVVAGELIVQLDGAKNVVSASGEVLPDLSIDVAPALGAE